jgi:hypothetical protein
MPMPGAGPNALILEDEMVSHMRAVDIEDAALDRSRPRTPSREVEF